MTIQVLPAQLASQIAAGEVVERPSSVIKELVENALDAGARAITITVRGGGRDLLQVADDGHGISAAEIETAFLRHATSKLQSVADLERVRTLGFRGEALAAISAVSRLTIVSRDGAAQAGTRLLLEGGHKSARELVGAPSGTIISVESLFYNTPARLKFLKSVTTEKRLIDEFVTRYALAYPDVRFRLTHDNRVTFQTTGNGNVREVLAELYGAETARALLEVGEPGDSAGTEAEEERAAIEVAGFVGPPDLNWANRTHITLFVNGRWIKDASLTYAVVQAYHTLLPTGRYPLGVLFIAMPPEEVDVNVHPAKTEVRFRRPNHVFGAVQRAVRQTLIEKSPVRAAGGWTTGSGFVQVAPQQGHDFRWPAAQQGLGLDWSQRQMGAGLPQPQHEDAPATEQPPPDPDEAGRLPIMRVIGQVGAAYIVTEGPDGLYLIDQHAAHERILYEQFLAQWEQQQVAAQGLVTATAVQLSPAQADLLEENLARLAALGFQVEPFGPQTFQIRAVPAVVAKIDPAQTLRAVLDDLEAGAAPLQDKIEARIVLRVCKSAAVKAGQTLSRAEMEALVQSLEACANPHTCPHGRPTLIHLSVAQLAREFGRT